MTNEKLLRKIEIWYGVMDYEHGEDKKDIEALAQLRAMLQEPTSEEQAKLLEHFNSLVKSSDEPFENTLPIGEITKKRDDKIRALITSPKRTVTREWITTFEHDMRNLFGLGPRRDFHEKFIERKLAELGIDIDRGDVPVVSEEGFSNENKGEKT